MSCIYFFVFKWVNTKARIVIWFCCSSIYSDMWQVHLCFFQYWIINICIIHVFTFLVATIHLNATLHLFILIFSSTGRRPEELMSWRGFRRLCVRLFLVYAIKSTVFIRFFSNLFSVFILMRTRTLLKMGYIRVKSPELSPLEFEKIVK